MITLGETKPIACDVEFGGYTLTKSAKFFVGLFPEQTIRHGLITLTTSGWLHLGEGFWWDGASGPAIDTESNMRASLVHDALINLVQAGLLPNTEEVKVKIDTHYFRLAREDGMGLLRSIFHLFAVQWNKWHRKLKRVLT